MTSARPPTRGDGHAAADDLAEREQVGRDQPVARRSSPHQPATPTRKPVSTSSWMSERAVRVRELGERAR